MYRTIFDLSKKEWSGIHRKSVYNPSVSIGAILLDVMTLTPNKVSQISADSGIRLTFDEIRLQTIRAAQNLQKYGYEKGDVFGIVSKNHHQLAPIVFASLCTGNPINTLDVSFTENEMSHMLNTTKPKVVFCDYDVIDIVKKSLKNVNNDAKIFTFCKTIGGYTPVSDLFAETSREEEFQVESVDEKNEIAFIVCSSGTTGLSKGVCLSHQSILDQNGGLFWFNGESTLLSFSSLYWLSGVMYLLLGTMRNCTRIITTEKYSAERFLELVEQHKVTNVFSSSFQLINAAKCKDIETRDLSSVRMFMAGGSKVPYEASVLFKKYIPNGEINVAYGMSEVAGCVSINYPSIPNDTVGRLVPAIKVKIVNDDGKRLGINETGEIRIKQNVKFYGYYNNSKSSQELFDDEGFMCTGDIGKFDEFGNLYILDRKKDFLRYRGYMISPSEIEDFLITLPEIKSTCVVGVDDYLSGDLPAVAIVRVENAKITEQEIYEICANQFSDSKKLRGGIYFVDSLPTTPSGKILRREVKRLVNELYKNKIQLKAIETKTNEIQPKVIY